MRKLALFLLGMVLSASIAGCAVQDTKQSNTGYLEVLTAPKTVDLEVQIPEQTHYTISRTASCMQLNLYREAGNGTKEDMIAVAQVVMRRVAERRWGNDVCSVILARNQFSWTRKASLFRMTSNNVLEQRAYALAGQVTQEVLRGEHINVVRGANHYHATYVAPAWKKKMKRIAQVGKHVFYQG